MVYLLNDFRTIKNYCIVIGILCITSVFISTVSATVEKCYVCPSDLEDTNKVEACHDPFDKVKNNETEFECKAIDDLLKDSAAANTTEPAPADPPSERLMELDQIDTSAPWKCYKAIGLVNGTRMTFRGCAKSCDEANKGLTAQNMKTPDCFECEENLCNSSDRLSPIRSTSFLVIAAICFGL